MPGKKIDFVGIVDVAQVEHVVGKKLGRIDQALFLLHGRAGHGDLTFADDGVAPNAAHFFHNEHASAGLSCF